MKIQAGALSMFFVVASAMLTGNNEIHARGGLCPPNVGPDVIVGELANPAMKWGTVGNISAYSWGTTSCNIGDQVLPWFSATPNHPVIAENMYRLKDGRFEQIGVSWIKHGFGALQGTFCCTCIPSGNFSNLGVGCSDPYCSSLNGDQDGSLFGGLGGLGPRSDLNPSTGVFPHPYSTQGVAGDAIFKRVQVNNNDLDPALNPGALYFAEGHYITPHDTAAGNTNNNASYAPLTVGAFAGGGWNLVLGPTDPMKPAIQAWQDIDPTVGLNIVDVPNDGRFMLGSHCTDNGNGTWHYEYALYNMYSNRAAGTFSIPLSSGMTITNISFHDINYHSGELYDGTDWPGAANAGDVSWATTAFAVNPNANALRWGTIYNFRFDANSPPTPGSATIGMFGPDATGPATVSVTACVPQALEIPGDTNGDGVVDVTDLLALLSQWGPCSAPCTPGIGNPLCTADTNDDCEVNITDLLTVFGSWSANP